MKIKKYKFEVCAGNWNSALNAQCAGADRIELCSALDVGGITPSAGLLQAVCKNLTIPAFVLIRPREGDFCFNQAEIDLMCADIQYCREQGCAGVVVGALKPDRRLDLDALSRMIAACGPMELVFHRAFDFVLDPYEAIDQLTDMGFKRILSSGQEATALAGKERLRSFVDHANGRIEVMPGAGIQADNIGEIASVTGALSFHFTAKKQVGLQNSEIPGLEGGYWESSEAEIRRVMEAI